MSFEKMGTLQPLAHSLQPLTRSSQELTNASQKSAEKAAFATEKARQLLGQFRRGEANDPGTFIASVAAVLSRYSESIVAEVTDPRRGLATETDWLPTVREVSEACEALAMREALAAKSNAMQQQTLAMRADDKPRAERPTLSELQKKYGPNWGLTKAEVDRADRHIRRMSRIEASLHANILAEYARLGREPVYATYGGEAILISPDLDDQIHPFRRVERPCDSETMEPE